MKWFQVIEEVQAVIMAESALTDIYGDNVRMNGTATFQVPCLEMQIIGDVERETDNPILVQIDQWCRSMDELARSEQVLRRWFHVDVPRSFGGLMMWAEYEDGESLASPDRDNVFARAIRFRFTPLRDRYDPAPTP